MSNEKNFEEKIRYKLTKNNNKLKIFGENFVKNNENNFKIIFDDKEINLCSFLDLSNYKKNFKVIEIILKQINDITNISKMFSDCNELMSFPGLSKFNIDNVTDISFMFSNCSSLSTLPNISKWNTSKVKNMSCLFQGCSLLNLLPDISNWNTSNVTNMSKMFYGCSSLKTLPDISKWNIQNVTNMNAFLQGCSLLSTLPDISKWDTSNISNMSYMFYGCKLIKNLPDISKWKTNKVTDMSYMFYFCSELKSLPNISIWNVDNLTKSAFMFVGCSLSNVPSFSKKNFQSFNNNNNSNNNKAKQEEYDLNKLMNQFKKVEINTNKYYLSCYQCHNVPNVLLKNNENILMLCNHCNKKENENIKNIANFSSKWVKKMFYYCTAHREKIKTDSEKYCKTCDLFLCRFCHMFHKQKRGKHEIVDLKEADSYFCDEHLQKLNFYCNECKYEICSQCKDIYHKNHNIQLLENNCNKEDILNVVNFNNFLENAEKAKKSKCQIVEKNIEAIKQIHTDDENSKNKLNENIKSIIDLKK